VKASKSWFLRDTPGLCKKSIFYVIVYRKKNHLEKFMINRYLRDLNTPVSKTRNRV